MSIFKYCGDKKEVIKILDIFNTTIDSLYSLNEREIDIAFGLSSSAVKMLKDVGFSDEKLYDIASFLEDVRTILMEVVNAKTVVKLMKEEVLENA